MSVPTVTTANGATWQEVAADRVRHRDATIAAVTPPLPQLTPEQLPSNVTGIPKTILSPDELAITDSNTEDIAAKLATREWTATAVIQAFLRRAGLASRLTNCVTELLPERALARAKELDEYFAKNGKPVGPLHGVPISVKEHVGMKGLDLNAGFVSWVGKIAEEDALILQILRDAGAVFYARTTQPQTLMHIETDNCIYGVTVNPFNKSLSPGGSSGGESALISLRGSVLGIGTDIGGSIRVPASNTGLFGFKPTTLRLPVKGWTAAMAGTEAIIATIGPITTSYQATQLFVKTLLDAKPWLRSPELIPLEWRDASSFPSGRKLKIAVMWDDGVVKPHPPVTRAMKELVAKLEKSASVEVVEWKPWKHDLAWEIIANLYMPDGGQDDMNNLEASREPLRPLTKFIIKENPHVQKHDIPSLWKACIRRDEYRNKYAELWNETAGADGVMVDAILCPTTPGVATKHDTGRYWCYTSHWNLLDYPAVVFPTNDHVSPEKDGGAQDYSPANEADAYNWNLWKEHGAEGYKDAPLSLQLVGRRYEDEKLLRSLEIILQEADLPFSVSA